MSFVLTRWAGFVCSLAVVVVMSCSDDGGMASNHESSGGRSTGGNDGGGAGGNALGGDTASGGSVDASGGGTGEGGVPALGGNDGLGGSGGEEPPSGCFVSSKVSTHVAAMAASGWAAKNVKAAQPMFGCAGAASTSDCLSAYPRADTTIYGADWEDDLAGASLRVLYTTNYQSAYRTRTSLDGRYVAHGRKGGGAVVIDLSGPSVINVDAAYLPAFLPEGTGFLFAGTQVGTVACRSDVLLDTNVAYQQCSKTALTLYQDVGTLLSGTVSFGVEGAFESDNPVVNSSQKQDPSTPFDTSSHVDFVPLVFDGSKFLDGPLVRAELPMEGDLALSPSTKLLMSRIAGENDEQDGYRLHSVDITHVEQSYTIDLAPVAHYCFNGAAPSFSYDERFVVLHHYVADADAVELGFSGSDDPAFQNYKSQGAANVYLVDLSTGKRKRVTRMAPGQFAVYPHFRSDGWIYFIVRTAGETVEHVVASDAAVIAAN